MKLKGTTLSFHSTSKYWLQSCTPVLYCTLLYFRVKVYRTSLGQILTPPPPTAPPAEPEETQLYSAWIQNPFAQSGDHFSFLEQELKLCHFHSLTSEKHNFIISEIKHDFYYLRSLSLSWMLKCCKVLSVTWYEQIYASIWTFFLNRIEAQAIKSKLRFCIENIIHAFLGLINFTMNEG